MSAKDRLWPTLPTHANGTFPQHALGFLGLTWIHGIRGHEFRLNPTFTVHFLLTQNLTHQGILTGLILLVRVGAWFPAGAARRVFPLAHGQILLKPGFGGSVPSQGHCLAGLPGALELGEIRTHQAGTRIRRAGWVRGLVPC